MVVLVVMVPAGSFGCHRRPPSAGRGSFGP